MDRRPLDVYNGAGSGGNAVSDETSGTSEVEELASVPSAEVGGRSVGGGGGVGRSGAVDEEDRSPPSRATEDGDGLGAETGGG